MDPSLRLILEAFKAGTVAAFAMPLAGMLSKPFFGWRIWQYGKKVAQVFVADVTPAILFAQHMAWAWSAALLAILALVHLRRGPIVPAGAALGAAYCVAANLFALPLYFGDPLPWQQTPSNVIQPLIVLVAFGTCVAVVSRRYVAARRRGGR